MKNSKKVREVLHAIVHGSIHHKDDPYPRDGKMTPYSALQYFDEGENEISFPVKDGDKHSLVTVTLSEPSDGYKK